MMDLKKFIRDVPDFPKQGILFKDITPLLADKDAMRAMIDDFVKRYKDEKIDVIIAAEARGFIIAGALAHQLGVGFAPVRKKGKLPYKTIGISYELEYGSDSLYIHEDAIAKGSRVLVVDDLLATGGTAKGMCDLTEKLKGEVCGIAFIIELSFLMGREKLQGYDIYSQIVY